jgi:hypothetical protein
MFITEVIKKHMSIHQGTCPSSDPPARRDATKSINR